jgi:CubicO group peptidase (beta-lactamase class C family)
MNTTTQERIARIISNLQPATAFQGKFGGPASLAERMAYHQTPGVSIAVIDNFKIDWAQGFGVRDVRSNYKVSSGKSTNSHVTTETIFQAGSNSSKWKSNESLSRGVELNGMKKGFIYCAWGKR